MIFVNEQSWDGESQTSSKLGFELQSLFQSPESHFYSATCPKTTGEGIVTVTFACYFAGGEMLSGRAKTACLPEK